MRARFIRLLPLLALQLVVANNAYSSTCTPISSDPDQTGPFLAQFTLQASQQFQGGITVSNASAGKGLVELFQSLNRTLPPIPTDAGHRVRTRNPLPLGRTRFSGFHRIFDAADFNLTIDLDNNARDLKVIARWRSTDDLLVTETYSCTR
jgi:hypothetical protein